MLQKEAVVARLERDRLRYLDLLELLRRGSAELRYAEEEGLLLYDRGCGGYFLTAETEAGAERMVALIPADADLLVAHEEFCVPKLRARLGLAGGLVCHQAGWMKNAPPEPAADFAGELRPLDASYAEQVREIYAHAYADLEYINGVIERGALGAFVNGRLAGIAGTHDEGTIGLLHVWPEYRRRGIAEALYRAMIRRLLERGGYALGHVEAGNEASLALQRKVGMSISEHLVYWVF